MGKADQIFGEVLAVMSGDAAQRAADELTFRSYRSHRERLSAETCAVFPNSAALEQRYWDEINAYADSKIRSDKEARHAGGPDLDFVGRILKAGH